MQNYSIRNLGRNETRTQHMAGATFIYIKKAPNDIIVIIDNDQKLTMPEGAKLQLPKPVEYGISIENTGESGDFEIVSGKGGDYIEPQIVGEVVTTPKAMTGIKTGQVTAGATTSPLVQGDVGRFHLRVKNLSTTDKAKIGAIDVEANGWMLAPGQEVTIKRAASAELYCIRDVSAAADVQLDVFEEFDRDQQITIPVDTLLTEKGGYLLTESGDYLTA